MLKDMIQLLGWESDVKIGDAVTVRWRGGGSHWSGKGTVSKINAKSVVVTLDEEVGGPNYYPKGHKIRVPMAGTGIFEWNWDNGIFPLEVPAETKEVANANS